MIAVQKDLEDVRIIQAEKPRLFLPFWARKGDSSMLSWDAHGHVATITGPLPTVQGYDFDGTDDRMTIPNADDLNLVNLTVMAWAKADVLGNMTIADKANENDANFEGWQLRTDAGAPRFRVRTPTENAVQSPSAIVAGLWYLIMGVVAASNLLLYVNGELVATATLTGTLSSYNVPMTVGAHKHSGVGGGFQSFWDGPIDMFALIPRPLSVVEAAQHYAKQSWRYR